MMCVVDKHLTDVLSLTLLHVDLLMSLTEQPVDSQLHLVLQDLGTTMPGASADVILFHLHTRSLVYFHRQWVSGCDSSLIWKGKN